jgi:hypothetical protein
MSETTTAPAGAGAAPPADLVRELEAVLGRRIEVVEHENQRLRRMNRLALVGVAAAFGVSAVVLLASGVGRSTLSVSAVEAERFVLRTPGGETRGEWRVAEGGSPELLLRDADGRTRAKLAMLPDGSTGISFADASGSSRAALGLLPDQTTSLVFADRTGRTRAVLGYSPDGAMTLVFADRAGVTRAGLGVDAAGRANLTLTEDQAAPEPVAEAAVPEVSGEAEAAPGEAEAPQPQTPPGGPAARGRR